MVGDLLLLDEQTTELRRSYLWRLALRCLVLVCCILLLLLRPGEFSVLEGGNFFRGFSVLHLLWAVWMADMAEKLVPAGKNTPLGSHKIFRRRCRQAPGEMDEKGLRQYLRSSGRAALVVALLWAVLLAVIGFFYYTGRIGAPGVFLSSVFFYVCDLICVLIWCPFRLILKNRCCTTCRIFNWDHLMMFSPMILLHGFYPRSLVVVSLALWVIWELCVLAHPERFWEGTNEALRCSACTDKLCTQYCQKRRR